MANLQQLTQRSEVGAIKPWGKATAPDGYVLCDGASLTRTGTYADLFAVIGTTYGSADGSSFNVPDLQGKMPQGYDGSTYNLAGTGGANTVTVAVTNNQAVSAVTNSVTNNQAVSVTGSISNTSLTTAQLASHTHNYQRRDTSGTRRVSTTGPEIGFGEAGSGSAGSGTGHTHSHTLSGTLTGSVAVTSSGGALSGSVTAAGNNTFSPYVVVNYIIRY
jgi:microcystin-dependent protein